MRVRRRRSALACRYGHHEQRGRATASRSPSTATLAELDVPPSRRPPRARAHRSARTSSRAAVSAAPSSPPRSTTPSRRDSRSSPCARSHAVGSNVTPTSRSGYRSPPDHSSLGESGHPERFLAPGERLARSPPQRTASFAPDHSSLRRIWQPDAPSSGIVAQANRGPHFRRQCGFHASGSSSSFSTAAAACRRRRRRRSPARARRATPPRTAIHTSGSVSAGPS